MLFRSDNSPTARRDGYAVGAAHGHAQRASDSHANRDRAAQRHSIANAVRYANAAAHPAAAALRHATAAAHITATAAAHRDSYAGRHRHGRSGPDRHPHGQSHPTAGDAYAATTAAPLDAATLAAPRHRHPGGFPRAARHRDANGRSPDRRGDAGEHSRAAVHAYPDGRGRHHPAPPAAQPSRRNARRMNSVSDTSNPLKRVAPAGTRLDSGSTREFIHGRG